MTSQVYKMKGPRHKDRANPPFCHFVFIAGHIAMHACIQSIICIGEDFAELKEITVNINRFVFLAYYVRIECFQK